MIAIGNFLFKHRNYVFPLYILGLFVVFLTFGPPKNELDGSETAESLLDLAAVIVALTGLTVRGIVIGLAYIKRGGLNKKVYADNLVTEGMFSVCRNPLYVGNMLIYTGEFMMFGNLWCLLTGVLSFWFIYECIIAAEENFLHNKFGAAYEEYCKDVPRWLPMLSKIPEATAGMKFDWKKVIFKDYSTMCSTLVILACIQLWEIFADFSFMDNKVEVYGLVGFIIAILTAAFAVRVAKKSASSATKLSP